MDLSPNAPQEAFRLECRTWLQRELPWDYGVGLPPMFDDLSEEVAFLRDWQEKLAGAGLVGVSWPTEYGGRNLDGFHHYMGPQPKKTNGCPTSCRPANCSANCSVSPTQVATWLRWPLEL